MAVAEHNGYISRGNMTVIISAAGLVMLAFGGFITFQNNATDRRINDVKEDMVKLERDYLRKDEHVEFKLRVDKDLSRLAEDALRRQATVVPRSEHEARWESSNGTLRLLSERLNELRTATSSTYTLRDEITRLHNDMLEMRRQIGKGDK